MLCFALSLSAATRFHQQMPIPVDVSLALYSLLPCGMFAWNWGGQGNGWSQTRKQKKFLLKQGATEMLRSLLYLAASSMPRHIFVVIISVPWPGREHPCGHLRSHQRAAEFPCPSQVGPPLRWLLVAQSQRKVRLAGGEISL